MTWEDMHEAYRRASAEVERLRERERQLLEANNTEVERRREAEHKSSWRDASFNGLLGLITASDDACREAEKALAAMTAERNNTFNNLTLIADDLAKKLTASEAALRKYGRHLRGCTQTIDQVSEYRCNCGLADALEGK